MSNTRIWDKVSKPPKTALKQIGGGRLKGMTDINPQWRMQAMTELFGPCGMDWGYSILGFKTFEHEGEVALRAKVQLWYSTPDSGRNCIVQGIGGAMLVAKEKDGLRLNDEAWKMAVTDALSVAMKALGVGAEIYMGNWDGSKYRTTPKEVAGNRADHLAMIEQSAVPAERILNWMRHTGRSLPDGSTLADLSDQEVALVVAKLPQFLAAIARESGDARN